MDRKGNHRFEEVGMRLGDGTEAQSKEERLLHLVLAHSMNMQICKTFGHNQYEGTHQVGYHKTVNSGGRKSRN